MSDDRSVSDSDSRPPQATDAAVVATSEPDAVSSKPAPPFASFEDLMAAHAELLGREIQMKGSVASDVLANATDFIRRGVATGTRLDDPDERRTAQSLLNYWVTVLYRSGQSSPPEPILAYYVPRKERSFPSDACPYVGLRAFQEQDRDRFFGREEITAAIVKRLKESSVVVLVGPPGSGKTSLLNAGVIPQLKAETSNQGWTFFPSFTPGADPLSKLASLFSDETEPIVRRLLENPDYLVELVNNPNWGDGPRVIVIDQFEEVFTLCKDDQNRDIFLKSLLTLKQSGIKNRLLLTMRSDRLNQIIRRPELNEIFRDAEVRIYPPSQSELQAMIEKPASDIGLKFQPQVSDQIIREIYRDPGGLPLLQFVLLELWNDREDATITWSAMNRRRDCRQALLDKAEAFYESLAPSEKEQARRVLLRMVKLSDTWEAATEPVRREELYQGESNRAGIDVIVDKLLKANLARISNIDLSKSAAKVGQTTSAGSPDDQIELAHGTLAREWPRIIEWLRSLRESMATRQRLELFTANWGILGRGEKGLLDKYQLHDAQRFLANPAAAELGYDPNLEALVARSEKALARARWKQRALVLSSVVFLIVALVVILLFLILEHGRLKSATSTRLAFQARENLSKQLDLALLLGMEAYRKDNENSEARTSLMKALTESPKLRAYLYSDQGKIKQVVSIEGGKQLAVHGANGSVRLWNSSTHDLVGRFDAPKNQMDIRSADAADCSQLSADGRWLVTIEDGGALVMRRLGSSDERKVSDAKLACLAGFQLAVSRDDTKVAWLTLVPEASDKSARVTVWLTETNERKTSRQTYALGPIAFSPDNRTLAVTNLNHDIVVLQAESLTPIGRPLRRATSDLNISSTPIQFNKDGSRLASIKSNGAVGVWDVRTQTELYGEITDLGTEGISPDQNAVPSTFSFSGAGDKVVAAYPDGLVFFNLATKERHRYPAGHVVHITFSPDERRVVTVADEEQPLLWQRDPSDSNGASFGQYSSPIKLPSGRLNRISSVIFNDDSKLLAGACDDGTVVLWDLEQKLIGKTLDIDGVKDSQPLDYRRILIRTQSDEVFLFNTETGARTKPFSIRYGDGAVAVNDTVVSADGGLLIASYSENRVVVWNLKTGNQDFEIINPTDADIIPAIDATGQTLALAVGKELSETTDATGQILALASEIQFWNLSSRSKQSVAGPQGRVVDLTFSRDGKLLAVSDDSGKITLWDVQTQKVLYSLDDQSGSVSQNNNLEFTRDGSKLISLSNDHTLRLWALGEEKGKLLSKSATGMGDFVLSPDSQNLSVAGLKKDGSIVFWDLENSREQFGFSAADLASLSGGLDLTVPGFTSEGNQLVIRDANGKLTLLRVDLQSWIDRVCRVANRSLTFTEWDSHRVFEDTQWMFWRSKESLHESEPTCPSR